MDDTGLKEDETNTQKEKADPGAIKFNVDHIICGDTFRCIWGIREYPPQTTEQAILCRFGDKENVTVHIYSRFVDNMEQRRILQNATRKNKMLSISEDVQESITAEGNKVMSPLFLQFIKFFTFSEVFCDRISQIAVHR